MLHFLAYVDLLVCRVCIKLILLVYALQCIHFHLLPLSLSPL